MKKVITHKLIVSRDELIEQLNLNHRIFPAIPDDALIWLLSGLDRIPAAPVDQQDIIEIEWQEEEQEEGV